MNTYSALSFDRIYLKNMSVTPENWDVDLTFQILTWLGLNENEADVKSES